MFWLNFFEVEDGGEAVDCGLSGTGGTKFFFFPFQRSRNWKNIPGGGLGLALACYPSRCVALRRPTCGISFIHGILRSCEFIQVHSFYSFTRYKVLRTYFYLPSFGVIITESWSGSGFMVLGFLFFLLESFAPVSYNRLISITRLLVINSELTGAKPSI